MDRARPFLRPAYWALALLIGLSWCSGADAQLLPNAAVHKRQRPPREAEPPMYSQIRQRYWGYYPTCWRKFPDGWCCPNSEKPDVARSFREIPLVPPENLEGEDEEGTGEDPAGEEAGAGDEMNREPTDRGGRDDLAPPPLPERRSPFDPPAEDENNRGPGNDPFSSRAQPRPLPGPAALTPPRDPSASLMPPQNMAPPALPVSIPTTLGAQAAPRPEPFTPIAAEAPPILNLDPQAATHLPDVNFPRPPGALDGTMRLDSASRPIEMGTPRYATPEPEMMSAEAPEPGPRRKPFSTLFARFRRGS